MSINLSEKLAQVSVKHPHVQLKALAGTGKTTSVVEGLKVKKGVLPSIMPSPQQLDFWKQMYDGGKAESVRVSSFSTAITDELKDRLMASGLDKKGCEARGVHSLGYQAVNKALGRQDCKSAEWVVKDYICEAMGGDFRDLMKVPGNLIKINAVEALVSLVKQNLAESDPDTLQRLASHYDVDLPETAKGEAETYEMVPEILYKCLQPTGRINFDDMVWLPVCLDLPIERKDVQVIDEAQDLNKMQQELIYKAGHRIIFVGDPNQAIFGFAGADSESMPNMMSHLQSSGRGAVELPLTVTRRCSKAVVRYAQNIVPEYEAHADNLEGEIMEELYPIQGEGDGKVRLKFHETYARHVRPGDLVICRVNAPLVSQCFFFLRHGVKANILGRDVGKGLADMVKKSKATTIPMLMGWLDDWLAAELEKESKRRYPSENKVMALTDKHECLMYFCADCQSPDDVLTRIEQLFVRDSKGAPGVRLCSGHKSKGLESDRAFILMPPGAPCPHPMAKKPWQIKQESNLLYVMSTRAKDKLCFVY